MGHCGDADPFRWIVDGEHIYPKASSRHWLSVRQDNAVDGQELILWTAADENAFKWVLDRGFVKLGSDDRKCLSVREGKIGNGADVILWTCTASGSQAATGFQWSVNGDQIQL